jgi:hypothetical protein
VACHVLRMGRHAKRKRGRSHRAKNGLFHCDRSLLFQVAPRAPGLSVLSGSDQVR